MVDESRRTEGPERCLDSFPPLVSLGLKFGFGLVLTVALFPSVAYSLAGGYLCFQQELWIWDCCVEPLGLGLQMNDE